MSDSPESPQVEDSQALYAACGSRNQAEQSAAYEALWAYLYRVAAYMTRAQPDGEALAQDCAQQALWRVHQQYAQCQEPAAFRIWARRIVAHLVIDELRRRRRLQPLPEPETETDTAENGETAVLERLTTAALRQLLQQAPISDRSRRVVVGRYLDNLPDELLAQNETELNDEAIFPSHIQVTRAKNIAKLRNWPLLHRFLQEIR